MKKFLANNWQIIAVIVISLVTAWPLFLPGYFSHHDDLQVIRIFEMRKCFSDLQIPCRWAPDMGYGNGFPLFNFYSAFPYYLGGVLSFVFGFIGAAKILFLFPIVIGGLSMYLLAKEIFGKEVGLVASFLYTFVPYRALDTYARGAVAESFALGIIPLIFYFGFKLIKEKSRINFLGLTISLFILLTTHNIMTMFFLPILFGSIFIWLKFEKFKNLKIVLLSLALAFGLSAFFLIPAYFEKNLVTTETLTQGHLDYRVHFVAARQLFERTWGYGASVEGPKDGISFQIGWPHLLVVFAAVFVFLLVFKKISNSQRMFVGLVGFLFFASIFMTHGKSWFIWERLGILKYVQFPWRFLSITAFSSSLIGGFLVHYLPDRSKTFLISIILVTAVILNFNYFRPKEFYKDLTDQEKLSGELWRQQQKGGILDYLPKTASEPKELAPTFPLVRGGEAEVTNFINRSNSWEFRVNVKKDSIVEVPVFDFPNWQVRIGEKIHPHKAGIIGRITVELPEGEFLVRGELKNTPIRSVANITTAISFALMVIITIYGKSRKILG